MPSSTRDEEVVALGVGQVGDEAQGVGGLQRNGLWGGAEVLAPGLQIQGRGNGVFSSHADERGLLGERRRPLVDSREAHGG